MSSGERPIGTGKGKQPNTEALCQPPPPRKALRAPSWCGLAESRPTEPAFPRVVAPLAYRTAGLAPPPFIWGRQWCNLGCCIAHVRVSPAHCRRCGCVGVRDSQYVLALMP